MTPPLDTSVVPRLASMLVLALAGCASAPPPASVQGVLVGWAKPGSLELLLDDGRGLYVEAPPDAKLHLTLGRPTDEGDRAATLTWTSPDAAGLADHDLHMSIAPGREGAWTVEGEPLGEWETLVLRRDGSHERGHMLADMLHADPSEVRDAIHRERGRR